MKQCSKCGSVKSLTEFSKASKRPDGYQARCKDCHRKDQRRYRQENPVAEKEYYANNKKKVISRVRVKRATKRGVLPRADERKCAITGCDKQAAHWHHLTYDRAAKIAAVCATCHNALHRGAIADDEIAESIDFEPRFVGVAPLIAT